MTTEARKIRLIMELRKYGITNTDVLSAIEKIPREQFVVDSFLDQAYENKALPIQCGQTISQPVIVAQMTEQLELGDRMRVLEIGTGSGYQAVILSKLCRRVYSVERHKDLLKLAEERFKKLDIHNITTKYGDGSLGWEEQAPFDRIIVTAAASEMPHALIDQLKPGGILITPVGKYEQDLLKITKEKEDIKVEKLANVRFVPLVSKADE